MHGRRVTCMQATVSDRNDNSAAIVAERLDFGRMAAAIPANDLRRGLIKHLDAWRWLDPEHGIRGGERTQRCLGECAAPNVANTEPGLRVDRLQQTTRAGELLGRRIGREQDANLKVVVAIDGPCAADFAMDFVLGTERASPLHEGEAFEISRTDIASTSDKTVIGNVLDGCDTEGLDLANPISLNGTGELDEEKSIVRRRLQFAFGAHLGDSLLGLNNFVTEAKNLLFGKRDLDKTKQHRRNSASAEAGTDQGNHSTNILCLRFGNKGRKKGREDGDVR